MFTRGYSPFSSVVTRQPQRRTCVCAAICALMDALLRRPLDLRQGDDVADGATRAVQERHGDLFSLHYAGKAGGPESPCRPFILSFLVMQFLCQKKENYLDILICDMFELSWMVKWCEMVGLWFLVVGFRTWPSDMWVHSLTITCPSIRAGVSFNLWSWSRHNHGYWLMSIRGSQWSETPKSPTWE